MDRATVGNRVRELRRKRGMTGKELAERTALSAAAISKFERGLLRPTEEFLEKSIEALELSPKEALALRELGALCNSQFRRWGTAPQQIEANQLLIAKREKNAGAIRSYWDQIVPGLLQTESYMRAILPGFVESTGNSIDSIVKARLRRQKSLKKKSKSFVFVLGEATLRYCVDSPQIMIDQLTHLEELIENYPSVELRLLPFGQYLARVPLHHFVLYDERTVEIEVSKGQIDLWTDEDVQYYISLMNYLVSASLSPAKSRERIYEIRRKFYAIN